MRRIVAVCLVVVAGALVVPARAQAKPQRIASLNVCTDQLVLALADRSRIVSVTYLTRDPETSYYHEKARGVPINYGRAEEILAAKPDLVVAGRYTTGATVALLKRIGERVELFAPDDSLAAVRRHIRRMAKLLGEVKRGAAMIAAMNRRLAAIAAAAEAARGPKPVAAVFRASGFTMGRRSLVNDILSLAGYRNLSAEIGMSRSGFLSLERLIQADPSLIVFSHRTTRYPSIADQVLTHPALEALLASRRNQRQRGAVVIPASEWSCGGPFIVKAAEKLARERKSLIEEASVR